MAVAARSIVAGTQSADLSMSLVCEEVQLAECQQKVYKEWEKKVKEYDELMMKHKAEEEKYQKAVKAVDSRVGLKDSEHQTANGPTKFLRSVSTPSPQPISKPSASAALKSISQIHQKSSSPSTQGVVTQPNTSLPKTVVNGKQQLTYGGVHLNRKSPTGQLAPGVKMVVNVKANSQTSQRQPACPAPTHTSGIVKPGIYSIQNGIARQITKPNQPGVSWNNYKHPSVLNTSSKLGNISSVVPPTKQSTVLAVSNKAAQQPATSNQVAQGQKRSIETNQTVVPKRAKGEGINSKVLMSFYLFKKGKVLSTEDASRRFKIKCFHCNETMASNIQYATHVKMIVEKQWQATSVVCSQCFKRFRSQAELQEHVGCSHMKGAVFQCFTCDQSFTNNDTLIKHMHAFHSSCQMPFSCQICQYRTSAYADIIEHFSLKHEGYKALMCPYCLKMLRCSKTFLQHCQKHIQNAMRTTGGVYPCRSCKLSFLSSTDRAEHVDKDHKKYDTGYGEGVPRYVKDTLKALEIMATAGITGVTASKSKVSSSISKACMECGLFFEVFGTHLRALRRCSIPFCSYSSNCLHSFEKHMLLFHKNGPGTAKPFIGTVKKKRNADRSITLICKICNYQTKAPTHMAHHRAKKCVRRTKMEWVSYLYMPELPKEVKPTASSKMVDVTDVIVLDSEEDA